jgi:hypothetical protein
MSWVGFEPKIPVGYALGRAAIITFIKYVIYIHHVYPP